MLPTRDLYAPDMVAEIAERFLSLEGMKWSLAWGEYEDELYYSLRTSDRRVNAGQLIREVIEARGGSAGGHGTMAGARLTVKGLGAAAHKRLRERCVKGFLEAFGVRTRKAPKLA